MASEPIITTSEMEKLSPNERARLIEERSRDSLDGLSPEFQARVEEQGRRILEERGLLNPERS